MVLLNVRLSEIVFSLELNSFEKKEKKVVAKIRVGSYEQWGGFNLPGVRINLVDGQKLPSHFVGMCGLYVCFTNYYVCWFILLKECLLKHCKDPNIYEIEKMDP